MIFVTKFETFFHELKRFSHIYHCIVNLFTVYGTKIFLSHSIKKNEQQNQKVKKIMFEYIGELSVCNKFHVHVTAMLFICFSETNLAGA